MFIKFKSKDATSVKLQAMYDGYSICKIDIMKHMKVITKVKEEFQDFKQKLQEIEYNKKLCTNLKERLR